MESMPPLETVNQAVFTLYKNPNSVEKEKASLWLGELQKSVYAWKIADHILHHQTDVESCYFAAQTMRTKIQLAFHELPTDAHTSLRDSLMEHISKVNEATSSVIITQLCLALADLALQMPSWEKPVLDLINKFSATSLLPLLEIMTVLPEEVNSSRALRLGANRRKEILEELSQCVPTVSEFLNRCLSAAPDNPVIQVRVLRCFTSWVSVHAITLPEIAENSVVAEAFQILLNKQVTSILHEAAADCVCALLQCLEDNNNQQALEIQLFNGVMALEEGYHMSVAHEDEEKAINYCRIFTELAESFLEKIISGSIEKPHFALKILDLVLTCVGHHDYEVSAITFNLWYRLSEELYQKNNETLITLFKPYVARFIEALCRHCQMDPDLEGRLEDGADFADFRRKVSELIKDVVFIVGSSNCFRQMFINLQAPGVTWDSSEAALFIMQAVAKNILPEENDVVPKVVEAILNLPQNTHIAVRYTSILLLGELCEWIEKHPESLEPVLNCLLFCLQQPQLASAAATSLQSICSSCRNHMGVHFNGLVQIIQSLETFSISNEAAIGLLKGVSVILGRLPHDQIHQAMKEICWVQVKPLCELVQSDIKIERGTKSDPTLWLDRLAVIFRNTNPEEGNGAIHPCLGVFTEVWPIISTTLTKYQTNDRIMERCCRCLRYAVRCVGKSASHILEPLVKQIITIYTQHQHSCFLYLGSILVDEYGGHPGCVDGLLGMLQAFINPTFMLLQETDGLKNHPDTVDDFFRLCNRFIQRAPVAFLTLQSMPSILSCALLAATLDHKDANVSVMKFFYDIIHCGSSSPNKEDFPIRQKLVKEILSEQGGMLVNNLLQASVFSLHFYMLCDVADVILELKSTDKQATSRWLEEACTNLPTTNSVGTQTVTHSQLIDFHQNVMLSESSKEITHCLRDFARQFH
uniref:Transportin-3 n=1 Tax=Clastoptera arizonana TaxID=38151 RepID=A0A1B6DC68_9HEMI